jgi:prevent-host-death family protein
MSSRSDIIPITDLKANAAELLRTIAEEERTVTVTQNGEPRAVLMSVGEYQRWRAALALLKLVGQAEASAARGDVVQQDEVFRRAEAAIERARRHES